MAEVAVRIVLNKLADVIVNEAQFLGGVGKKVERVNRELNRIQCCLQDADSKRKGDARVQNWLNELRDVAYRIEDTTDTFFCKVGYTDATFSQKLKRLCNKPWEVYFLHKLGTELDDILNVLNEISKSKVTYGISDLKEKSEGEVGVVMTNRRATYQEVDESEVVGMQADKNNILKLLDADQISRRAVITIVGPGGVGKTTLAHMVYRSAKERFDYHVMLSISRQYILTDILRKMIKEDKHSVPDNQIKDDLGDLINKVKEFLSNRRYLIILDDVWNDDLWNQIKDALLDDKNSSRVLMTSRNIEVARSSDPQMAPHELHILDDGESLDLFLKKAFPYQEPGTKCPTDLLKPAAKLVNKCKGLPLALVVLGGILSTKEPSTVAWERVLQTMNWHTDGKDCMLILAMSYEDMPYYLKACFKYVAFFPEDHVISAKCLIRIWAAEGFIPLEGRPTIEIMAEDCLEELSKRSMIQVSSRSMNGMIKYFQVHDLLRDLAIHEAEQENFGTIFSQASASEVKMPNRRIRRASIQNQQINTQFMKYFGASIRSLFVFNKGRVSLQCSKFRLLKVLECVGVDRFLNILLKSSHELIHLKYLGIREGRIDVSSLSFHHMKNLETLNVQGDFSKECNVDALWRISTLRHVRCDDPIMGPISTSTVSNLKTMQWVKPRKSWARKLPLLNNLRKLGVRHVEDWVTMTNLLKTLHSLVSLKINSYNIPVEIAYPKALPNYESLQSLYLRGHWSSNVTLQASLFPPQLIKLTLRNSKFEQNPMSELGKLKSLKKLVIRYVFSDSYSGPTIICSEGFPVLQYLELTCGSKVKKLTVAQGVMPKLTYLKVPKYTELHLPPELQHVTVDFNYS
ncbi:disease resistance protein RPP13-like isoform X1 [Carex rostrata]